MADSAEAKHTKRKDPKEEKNRDRDKGEKKLHKVRNENRSKVSQILKQYQYGALTEEELELELEEAHGENGSIPD